MQRQVDAVGENASDFHGMNVSVRQVCKTSITMAGRCRDNRPGRISPRHTRRKQAMLILNADEVRHALPMPQAIVAMKHAFAAFSAGQVDVPQRVHLTGARREGRLLVRQ
jgi:hypothetical protein